MASVDLLSCSEALQERETLLDELDMPLQAARKLADDDQLSVEQAARLQRVEELVWMLCA